MIKIFADKETEKIFNATKNIQFPYSDYLGHFCLGIIYSRVDGSSIDETKAHKLDELQSISSVVKDFQFFVAEKSHIARDPFFTCKFIQQTCY